MDLWSIVKKYYIDSIVYKQGYNVVNTLTWAVLLLLAVVLLYRYLSKRIDFDVRFFIAMVPFIVFGSSLRIVEDAGFLRPPVSYLFMTPLIYILVFSLAFPTLLISLKIAGENYHKICASAGVILSAAVLVTLFANLRVENWWVLPLAALLAFAASLLFYAIAGTSRNVLSVSVIFSQMLDGFSSYLGIKFLGYWELHVLPRFLIGLFGEEVLPVVKFIVASSIIYFLDASEEQQKLRDFLKFVLLVLGLAPGLRNALRMTFGV